MENIFGRNNIDLKILTNRYFCIIVKKMEFHTLYYLVQQQVYKFIHSKFLQNDANSMMHSPIASIVRSERKQDLLAEAVKREMRLVMPDGSTYFRLIFHLSRTPNEIHLRSIVIYLVP